MTKQSTKINMFTSLVKAIFSKDIQPYKSKNGFTIDKYKSIKSKAQKYANSNKIGLVKAAETILKEKEINIFFQGLRFEGMGNKL